MCDSGGYPVARRIGVFYNLFFPQANNCANIPLKSHLFSGIVLHLPINAANGRLI